MLSHTVRRGDARFPTIIEDDFNRANSSDLGTTSVGFLRWKQLRGSWSISSNRLRIPTSTSLPLVVVNPRRSDGQVEMDVSNQSGDGIAFRVLDADNFFRLAMHYTATTTVTTTTGEPIIEENFIYITVPVEINGTWHEHDYATWEVNGPNDFRQPTHDHGIYGDHGDPLALGPFKSRVQSPGTTQTFYTTTAYYTVHLDRIQNGSVTSLNSWTLSGSPGRLGIELNGDQITAYRNTFFSRVVLGTVTSTFNQNATLHGVSRRPGGTQGTKLDNFSFRSE